MSLSVGDGVHFLFVCVGGGAARGIALRLARPDEVDAHPDNPFPLAVEQADAGHTPHGGAPGWRSLK